MKKLVSLLLALCMLVLPVLSMAEEVGQQPTPAVHRQDYDHSAVDTKKPYTVLMYLVGDKNQDMDPVLAEMNKILQAEYNTTLDIQFLSWSDYQTLYPLILSGGEKVDLIYTASWCYLYPEAAKGSFFEMDMDFIEKYMPMTYKNQVAESWGTTTIGGSIVGVPCNMMVPQYKFPGIRWDLAQKHGITEVPDSWEDWMNYALTIAEKETPESGILALASAADNIEVWRSYYQQFNAMGIYNDDWLVAYPEDGILPEAEEIKFAMSTDWFRSFAHDMKKLADAGAWSRAALNNTIANYQAFGNGTGATTFWNGSIFSYMRTVEKTAEGIECVPCDLSPNSRVFCEEYNNSVMAIAANSENPERAALVADLISYDYELNLLALLGIEGTHWTEAEGGRFYSSDDASNGYQDNTNAMGWWAKKDYKLGVVNDQQQEDYNLKLKTRMTSNPCITFVFDEAPVKPYMAAINNIRAEYFGVLTLGLVDDVDATLAEFEQKLKEAGIQKVYEEFYKQYNAWKATR
ncbi:MAG: ABC transporter substrate-binding protein [Clostridia bacterium]|nr:ABC transporter substrate-binding protein [Clostridia bacterium]